MSDHTSELRSFLRRIRRRWMALAALRLTARAAAGGAAILGAALVAYLLVLPAGFVLLGIVAAALASALAWIGWAMWPLRRIPSDRQVARFVEEHRPELEDALASAVDFGPRGRETQAGGVSPVVERVFREACHRIRDIGTTEIVATAAIRRAAGIAAVAVAILAIALVASRRPARDALETAALYINPPGTGLEVSPGDVKLRPGSRLVITARVRGLAATRHPVLTYGSEATEHSAAMPSASAPTASRLPREFRFVFDSVNESFDYRIAAGAMTSDRYTVRVLQPPRVERIDLRYEYPQALGLAPREEADGGDIYGPAGTRVRLRVLADQPVRSGSLVMAGGARIALESRSREWLEGELRIVEDGSYRIALADPAGVPGSGENEYFIRILDDRPPDVRIVRPAGDRQVTPLEEVAIEARADDDYGIERLELVYAVRGRGERVVRLGGNRSTPVVSGAHTLYLEDFDIGPGDFITYYARARDVGRGKRSTESRSDIFFLEVQPFDLQFAMADSRSMGGGGNRTLDDLAVAQKEIIVASWKLERRALPDRSGKPLRSEQDIRALGRAQGELKERAQEMVTQAMGRARPSPATGMPDTSPRASDSAMARAVDAMDRAQTSLEALNVANAIPPEMEALNELLRAQTENKRQQVAPRQQAGEGMGGSGRTGRDLSALFDRELQRQQRTNYETPPQVRPEGGQAGADTFERIRELARRQRELADAERQLAGQRDQMKAEELKRQLERLTRDQLELRRQAEELSRALGRQSGGRGGEAGSAVSDDMRDISEDMRSAASELRREDLAAAGSRAGRALEKLRNVERRLASNADAPTKGLGGLELEARQLADTERDAADEAESVGRGRAADAARTTKTLAKEQEKLAERVERLTSRASDLAGRSSLDASQKRALAGAAAELKRGRLDERIRQSAEELRRLGDRLERGDRSAEAQVRMQAEAERELARALDRAADEMGAAAAPGDEESRGLARQLARARDLRDRLAQLERQMREVQSPIGGEEPSRGDGERERRIAELRQEFANQMGQATQLARELGQSAGGTTPEGQTMVLSSPGTEAFKQDFTRWDELRRYAELGLEQIEVSLAERLREKDARDRLNAGPDESTPQEYRRLVDEYYRSLAKTEPKPRSGGGT